MSNANAPGVVPPNREPEPEVLEFPKAAPPLDPKPPKLPVLGVPAPPKLPVVGVPDPPKLPVLSVPAAPKLLVLGVEPKALERLGMGLEMLRLLLGKGVVDKVAEDAFDD